MQQQEEPVANPLALAIRNIGATIAGIFVGGLIIGGVEAIGGALYPSGLKPESTPEEFKAFMERASATQLAFPLIAYLIGAFAAAFLAHKLGRVSRPVNSIAAGGFLALMLIMTVNQFPHPFWFIVASLALIGLGTWLGYVLARRSRTGEIIV